jgi:hypothetical protein
MLPQSNADQRRNNLRNFATSAGDKNHHQLNQKNKKQHAQKCSRRVTRISAEIICGILRHLRETKIIPN